MDNDPTERAGQSSADTSSDVISQLERLAALKESGRLTEGEFAAQKATLLRQAPEQPPAEPVETMVPHEVNSGDKETNFATSGEHDANDGRLAAAVESPSPDGANSNRPEQIGKGMIIVGALMMAGSVFMDVGVSLNDSSSVVNVDLVSIRQLISITGGFLFLGGWLAIIAARLERLVTATPTYTLAESPNGPEQGTL